MAQITGLNTFTANTPIVAAEHNANNNEIQTKYNAHDTATTGVHGAGAASLVYSTNGGLVPIGTILPFYDFGAALTFDTNKFAYCDGSSKTINGTSRTLPDLSNRYLVGFGTEGGGDIDTATWATAAVGNASHQVDISHTHTSTAHSHGNGTLYTCIARDGNNLYIREVTDANWDITDVLVGTGNTAGGTRADAVDIQGDTAGTAVTTDSSLSATQSVQPRSIRVRYIMRYA